MKNLLFLIFLFLSGYIMGQEPGDIVAPSPNAAELGKYGMVPVGMFSGTAQYSVPLYEFKTQNLSLPVTLNYSTNGLVVDQVSSWVGHSWSLSAGGVITRSARGLPDIFDYRIPYPTGVDNDDYAMYSFLEANCGRYDVQPDIYAYNFAGYQGKFFIDTDGTVYLEPHEKLKVTQVQTGGTFVITTPDGVKYTFGAIEELLCNYGGCQYYTTYNNAWYLTKIEHPAGDVITLSYSTKEMMEYNAGLSQTIDKGYDTGVYGSCTNPDYTLRGTPSSTKTFHLTSISATGYGHINFQSTKDRVDLVDGYRLNKMVVYNRDNMRIKSVSFAYSFPVANSLYNPNVTISYNLMAGHTTEMAYRMYLTGLKIWDKDEVDYQSYTFDYNDLDKLPRRLSLAQDYYGYFNGVTTNNVFVPINKIGSTYLYLYSGMNGNREPNGTYSIRGTLHKITYPTGGSTTITYEPHQGGATAIGGCRVKKTESIDSPGATPIVKEYYYSDKDHIGTSYGVTHGMPTFCRTYVTETLNPINGAPTIGCYFYSVTSSSIYSINHNGQYCIVYPHVTVSDGTNFQNGGTEYTFKVASDVPATILNHYGGITYPLPQSNEGWSNGRKLKEIAFKKDGSGNFIDQRSEESVYGEGEMRNRKVVYCLDMHQRDRVGGIVADFRYYLQYYDAVKYLLVSEWKPLTKTIVTTYDDNGANPVVHTTQYTYDNATHVQPTRIEEINNGIKTVTTRKYYPDDYTSGSNLSTLKSKFIVAKPVDVRTIVDNKLTDGRLYKYNDYGQVTDVYLAENEIGTSLSFYATNPYSYGVLRKSYSYNTSTHRIQQVLDETGLYHTYLWSYGNAYVVAKVDNATLSQVNSATSNLSSTFVNDLGTATSQSTIDTKLAQLRTEVNNDLPSSMLTTYTYTPSIGLTSVTGVSGVKNDYQYDAFGRLRNILNDDSKVLDHYFYHMSYNTRTDEAPPELSVSPTSLSFPGDIPILGYYLPINVQSNTGWTASATASWISIKKGDSVGAGNETIEVTVSTNPSTDLYRYGMVKVKTADGSITKIVTVEQEPARLIKFPR